MLCLTKAIREGKRYSRVHGWYTDPAMVDAPQVITNDQMIELVRANRSRLDSFRMEYLCQWVDETPKSKEPEGVRVTREQFWEAMAEASKLYPSEQVYSLAKCLEEKLGFK